MVKRKINSFWPKYFTIKLSDAVFEDHQKTGLKQLRRRLSNINFVTARWHSLDRRKMIFIANWKQNWENVGMFQFAILTTFRILRRLIGQNKSRIIFNQISLKLYNFYAAFELLFMQFLKLEFQKKLNKIEKFLWCQTIYVTTFPPFPQCGTIVCNGAWC